MSETDSSADETREALQKEFSEILIPRGAALEARTKITDRVPPDGHLSISISIGDSATEEASILTAGQKYRLCYSLTRGSINANLAKNTPASKAFLTQTLRVDSWKFFLSKKGGHSCHYVDVTDCVTGSSFGPGSAFQITEAGAGDTRVPTDHKLVFSCPPGLLTGSPRYTAWVSLVLKSDSHVYWVSGSTVKKFSAA